MSKVRKNKDSDIEEKKDARRTLESPPKSKNPTMKTQKDKSEDEEMSDTLNQKAKASKSKKSTEQIKLKESKKVSKQSETGSKSKTKEVEMDIDNAASEVEDEKNADASQSEQSKSQLGKRPVDTRHVKNPEQKRQKTEKGEKSMVSEKRKVKHIEWQYGRHCSRDLWVGKKVKVKFPAKNKDDPADYRFGKLISIKENDKGEKTLFQIEWSHDKKKAKEWVDLNDNRIYIFGQILFLKHHHDNDQIEFIKKTYGWKGKDRKSIPIPVIELIDANDKNKRITPYEDINEKIPIQYFNMEKAKKIKQEVLYDYREFKEEHFDYIRDALKNGDKVHAKISNYKKHYSQWIEKHSKVDIAMNESIKDYTAKVVRVYKEERNCGKAIIMR